VADAKLEGKTLADFSDVTRRPYKDQGIFFLNAFWPEYGASAEEKEEKKNVPERIWRYWQRIKELDYKQYIALPDNKRMDEYKETPNLDEFWSHKMLEMDGKPLPVIQFRQEFRKIDLNFDNKMALIEYLVYEFKQDVKTLLARPQGTNEELVKAQAALDLVQQEITKIESKKADLTAAAEKGGVKGNAAGNELKQLLAADPLELNRAIISAEAAVRKASRLQGDQPQGALWWINRELTEAKKYKPKKAQ